MGPGVRTFHVLGGGWHSLCRVVHGTWKEFEMVSFFVFFFLLFLF